MADDATVEGEADAFDCDDCQVFEQLHGLQGPNRDAWELYRKVVVRLAADLHAGGVVLDRLTRDMAPEDFDDLWQRLTILYNALDPPPEPQKAG